MSIVKNILEEKMEIEVENRLSMWFRLLRKAWQSK
jgi:hypothetical protein